MHHRRPAVLPEMIPNAMKSAIVASAKPSTVDALRTCLGGLYRVDTALDRGDCIEKFRRKRYEFLFVDIDLLTSGAGTAAEPNRFKAELDPFRQIYPTVNIVVMTPQSNIRDAVTIVKCGADDYITFPINPEEVRFVTETIHEDKIKESELDYLRDRFWDHDALDVVRTNSPLMKTIFEKVQQVAPTLTTVMLYGETGTGKSVIARMIHRHSNRRQNRFIGVHCGAIPDTLVESELFGHEKGAFTGAVRRKLGKFEIARGGTIFLDEIGTISAATQVKLLQVLQDRKFQRVGGEEVLTSDARVIAASNMDLKAMSDVGEFRKDLYYRLNVFPIELPSLSERIEDLPVLVDIFLKKLNRYYGKNIGNIHPLVLDAFRHYGWPGNIRELENLIERAYILETNVTLTPAGFPGELFTDGEPVTQDRLSASRTLADERRLGIEKIEKNYLKEVLSKNRGRINESARQAGISTRQLHKLMSRYCIKKEAFK
jgi:DNA-binding NtrC family response regulator